MINSTRWIAFASATLLGALAANAFAAPPATSNQAWRAHEAAIYAAKQQSAASQAAEAQRRRDAAMAELRAVYAATAPRPRVSPEYQISRRSPDPSHYVADHTQRTSYAPRVAAYGGAAPAYNTGYPAGGNFPPANARPVFVPTQSYVASPADRAPTLSAPYGAPVYLTAPQQMNPHASCTASYQQPVAYYTNVAAPAPPVPPLGRYPVSSMPAPAARNPYYVGENLFGQPKLFVEGQPLRNAIRTILP